MEIRKMALALPLAFGIACSTSQSQRTASTEQPAPTPPPAGTAATTEGSPGAAGSDAEGGATATTTPGHGDDGTLSGESTMGGTSDIKGHPSDRVLMGKVASVSTSSLSIQSDMGDSRTLQVVPETIVTVDGRDGHISDIQQGQEIRASFNEQDGRQVAVKIEAGRAMGGHMGAEPDSTTGTGSTTDMGTTGSGTSTGTTTPDSGTGTGTDGTRR